MAIEQGLADTPMLPSFDQQLAPELAANGARVTYRTWPGAAHVGVVTAARVRLALGRSSRAAPGHRSSPCRAAAAICVK